MRFILSHHEICILSVSATVSVYLSSRSVSCLIKTETLPLVKDQSQNTCSRCRPLYFVQDFGSSLCPLASGIGVVVNANMFCSLSSPQPCTYKKPLSSHSSLAPFLCHFDSVFQKNSLHELNFLVLTSHLFFTSHL